MFSYFGKVCFAVLQLCFTPKPLE